MTTNFFNNYEYPSVDGSHLLKNFFTFRIEIHIKKANNLSNISATISFPLFNRFKVHTQAVNTFLFSFHITLKLFIFKRFWIYFLLYKGQIKLWIIYFLIVSHNWCLEIFPKHINLGNTMVKWICHHMHSHENQI